MTLHCYRRISQSLLRGRAACLLPVARAEMTTYLRAATQAASHSVRRSEGLSMSWVRLTMRQL